MARGNKPQRESYSERQKRLQAAKKEQAAKKRRRNQLIAAGCFVAVIVVAIAAGLIVMNIQEGKKVTYPASADRATYSIPQHKSGIDLAKVPRLDIYEDPRCFSCDLFEHGGVDLKGNKLPGHAETIEKLVDDGKVQVYYHVMNTLDSSQYKVDYSVRAANAMACAADVGKFRQMHDAIYSNFATYAQESKQGNTTYPAGYPDEGTMAFKTNDDIIGWAASAGITDQSFVDCAKSSTYHNFVKKTTDNFAKVQNANKQQLQTPTFYLNGKFTDKINYQMTTDELTKLITDAATDGSTPVAPKD